MADAVASQVLLDGPRNAVLKFTNVSDGTGETNALKVDASTLDGAPGDLRIDKIHFATSGMGVDILWNADSNVLAWHIPANQEGCFDFCAFGGLINDAGTGKNGDILFTTVGQANGDRYAIVLEMKKRGAG